MVCEVYWTELGVAVHLVTQFFLHFDVQRTRFQGIPPGLISGNIRVHADVAEVSQSIYCVQENCVTDLGNYYPPLIRSRLESSLRTCWVRFSNCRSRRVRCCFRRSVD